MVTCAVPGCDSSKKENPQKYTFHIFPQNIEVRKKWLQMINREGWVPKKYSTVCSKHFEQHCFSHRGAQRVKLCSGSVPTLFMPVVFKPIRKASSYVYRDISAVPNTSTGNISVVDNSLKEKKMKKSIDVLKKRLNMKQKKLKNVRAQKKRADQRVLKLSHVIKTIVRLPALQNDFSSVMLE